jgi:hypothetical protein
MIAVLHPRRLVMPVAFALMIGGAAWTYQAKDEAIAAANHVSDLRDQITQEQVQISLLKAEWSELTEPGRLQALIDQYPEAFPLQPFGIDQMVRIRDLPMAPEDQPDLIAEVLAGTQR